MTVPDLINFVLRDIWKSFYEPRQREFFRDKRHLLKAIAHYGYLCEQRGWNADPSFIACEIIKVLKSAATHKAAIKYLPVYLHEAIRRCVGQRAEEIQSHSRLTSTVTTRVIGQLNQVQAIRQRTPVEELALLYKSLRKRKVKKIGKQMELLK